MSRSRTVETEAGDEVEPSGYPYVQRAYWRTDALSCAVYVVIVLAAVSLFVEAFDWPWVGVGVFLVWVWAAHRMANEIQAVVWRWGRRRD